jgi:hypothetical protein
MLGLIWPKALQFLGFIPKRMSFVIGERSIDEIQYDEILLKEFMQQAPDTVFIREDYYIEDGTNFSFLISVDSTYKTMHFGWANATPQLLLTSQLFNDLIFSRHFISGYLGNHHHVIANDNREIFQPGKKFNSWGESRPFAGIPIYAASIMWFGNVFFKIISKEKFMDFPSPPLGLLKHLFLLKPNQADIKQVQMTLLKNGGEETIQINLFDIEGPRNEKRQKQFWKYFRLYKIMKAYENKKMSELGIDLEKEMNDYIDKMKKKRNKGK